jgi:hypothetical protein
MQLRPMSRSLMPSKILKLLKLTSRLLKLKHLRPKRDLQRFNLLTR